MTFSIVARSDDGESWGVAVASKFLAVGSVGACGGGRGRARSPPRPTPTSPTRAWPRPSRRRRDRQVALRSPGRGRRRAASTGRSASSTSTATPPARPARDCFDWAGGPGAGERAATRSRATSSPAPRWSRRWRRPGGLAGADAAARAAPARGPRGRRRGRGRQSRAAVGRAAGRTRRGGLRRPGRRRRRPARRRPPRPGQRAGPSAGPQRALPHRVDARRRRCRSTDELEAELEELAHAARATRPRRLDRHRELRDAGRPGTWSAGSTERILRRSSATRGGRMSVLAIDAGTTGVTARGRHHGRPHPARGYQEFAPALPQAGLGRARARGDLAGDARGDPRGAPRSTTRSRAAARSASPTSARRVLWDRETLGRPRRAIVWRTGGRPTSATAARRGPRGAGRASSPGCGSTRTSPAPS